jgi:hypothetical protein
LKFGQKTGRIIFFSKIFLGQMCKTAEVLKKGFADVYKVVRAKGQISGTSIEAVQGLFRCPHATAEFSAFSDSKKENILGNYYGVLKARANYEFL